MGRGIEHSNQTGFLIATMDLKRLGQHRVARQCALYEYRLPLEASNTLTPMAKIVDRYLNEIRMTSFVFHVCLTFTPLYKILRMAHQSGQDGFLGVETVLSLIEDHAVRTFDNLFRDLFPAMSRQAVHDYTVFCRHP